MERRANAILIGKNKNSSSSLSVSSSSKTSDISAEVKKSRYITNILNKSNKRDIVSQAKNEKSAQPGKATNLQATDGKTTLQKRTGEFGKEVKSITQETKSPDFLVTSINSNSGTL